MNASFVCWLLHYTAAYLRFRWSPLSGYVSGKRGMDRIPYLGNIRVLCTQHSPARSAEHHRAKNASVVDI